MRGLRRILRRAVRRLPLPSTGGRTWATTVVADGDVADAADFLREVADRRLLEVEIRALLEEPGTHVLAAIRQEDRPAVLRIRPDGSDGSSLRSGGLFATSAPRVGNRVGARVGDAGGEEGSGGYGEPPDRAAVVVFGMSTRGHREFDLALAPHVERLTVVGNAVPLVRGAEVARWEGERALVIETTEERWERKAGDRRAG